LSFSTSWPLNAASEDVLPLPDGPNMARTSQINPYSSLNSITSWNYMQGVKKLSALVHAKIVGWLISTRYMVRI